MVNIKSKKEIELMKDVCKIVGKFYIMGRRQHLWFVMVRINKIRRSIGLNELNIDKWVQLGRPW